MSPESHMTAEEFERLSVLAFAEGARKARERNAEHAVFHHRESLRYGKVERRPGYRGTTTCLDCYYGREWR